MHLDSHLIHYVTIVDTPYTKFRHNFNNSKNPAEEYNNGIKTLYFVIVFIHVLEALVAWKISRDLQFNTFDQMKWVLQTFYGGVFSLGHLVRIKAAAKKQA
ncbi:Hypothetical predicted protein [Paramuricea clavata]|uniref:Transmembrane protein 254 n=1 Tax=Paramuricea clavata TaxID=317549 RepID=A0A6S7I8P6_PARCT|nr:Hypothetical predicted protein [Paramuricea clavata]